MKFELYKEVALAVDLPAHNLKKGDVGTIVESFDAGKNPEPGYALEVFNTLGDTIDVVIVPESFLEPLTPGEVWHARPLAQAA
jgi:hypothetical protein